MFYLSGTTEPTNGEELIRQLDGGIRQAVAFPAGGNIVTLAGSFFPAVDLLQIDLTGGRIDPSKRVSPPTGTGQVKPAITARQLQIRANPILIDTARAKVDLSASDVTLQYDVDAAGRLLLMPAGWSDGRAMLEIARADLEALILSQATIAAMKQGAKITQLQLQLTRLSDRSLAINVRVSAKKMMMPGTVRITGELAIDQSMVARISKLTCDGDGVVGKIAAGVLQPKIRQVEGKSFPLADFALAGLRPRDVRLESVDPVRVVAEFGS